MDYENWYRLSMADKIRRFEPVREPEPVPEPEPVWSLLEAMDIGSSILALMEERALATSQV
jgi:hypothetical protein